MIKARMHALGSKQHTWEGYKKEYGAPLTLATDSVIVTSVIEANEKRDTTTLDLPGIYLHAENNKHIIILLKGKLVELLVQIDPLLYRM